MTYQIEISPTAVADIENIFLFYILFTVHEEIETDSRIVRIHRVRHGSQKRLDSIEQLLGGDSQQNN